MNITQKCNDLANFGLRIVSLKAQPPNFQQKYSAPNVPNIQQYLNCLCPDSREHTHNIFVFVTMNRGCGDQDRQEKQSRLNAQKYSINQKYQYIFEQKNDI
ncbi:hypothetical protein GUJ93_ZPchr0004g38498 [Zizania palustris]|uniref:Uncharacterized protein n=1 Tax=Zizania palustris TaxID=103762 RepID=A0A8J5VNQ0_ZIZPA|nr:hypothetical protein GUJ93_ZPchr0004g38498 [Zizania palustris]